MIPPMRSLIGLTGVFVLALFSHVEASTLNKCIDAKGEVTYSNLPCANAQKTRTVEIDPAPQGKVIDKMDQAHRKGYTQKQMDAWNLEVKELERKKQQSGCF